MMERFLIRFPEFGATDHKLIAMALAEAKHELNAKLWGELYDTGLMFLAADKLAMSPMGEPVRLEGSANQTTYRLEFERLCRLISMGARVC
jgi:hypothetical protein